MHTNDECDRDMKQQSPLHDTTASMGRMCSDKRRATARRRRRPRQKPAEENWETGKTGAPRYTSDDLPFLPQRGGMRGCPGWAYALGRIGQGKEDNEAWGGAHLVGLVGWQPSLTIAARRRIDYAVTGDGFVWPAVQPAVLVSPGRWVCGRQVPDTLRIELACEPPRVESLTRARGLKRDLVDAARRALMTWLSVCDRRPKKSLAPSN